MRKVIASSLVIGLFASSAAAEQVGAGKPAVKACSLLPKDLAMKVSGAANKSVFDLPPDEETVGTGSACEYGDIRLQIDAFGPDVIDRTAKSQERGAGSKRAANWVPVPGVGDRAYFNADRSYAELMGYVGRRTFTIQMGVPFQSTAEAIKPNVIALANAIVPKLK
jgi:hypothetical protein